MGLIGSIGLTVCASTMTVSRRYSFGIWPDLANIIILSMNINITAQIVWFSEGYWHEILSPIVMTEPCYNQLLLTVWFIPSNSPVHQDAPLIINKSLSDCIVYIETNWHIEDATKWRLLSDDIFQYIFLNEYTWIVIKISLMFVHQGPINNFPALMQTMAWRRPGDKPLS